MTRRRDESPRAAVPQENVACAAAATKRGDDDVRIDHEPHLMTLDLSGRQQASPGVSEHGDGLLALDARKPLQEIAHARARFEVLEQGAHGNPRAGEYAGSPHTAGNPVQRRRTPSSPPPCSSVRHAA